MACGNRNRKRQNGGEGTTEQLSKCKSSLYFVLISIASCCQQVFELKKKRFKRASESVPEDCRGVSQHWDWHQRKRFQKEFHSLTLQRHKVKFVKSDGIWEFQRLKPGMGEAHNRLDWWYSYPEQLPGLSAQSKQRKSWRNSFPTLGLLDVEFWKHLHWRIVVLLQLAWGYWLWRPTMTIFCPWFPLSFALLLLTRPSSSSSSSSSCVSETPPEALCSSSSRVSRGFIRPYRKVKKPFNQSEPPSSTSSNQSRTSGSPWPSPSLVRPTQIRGGEGWMEGHNMWQ